MAEFHERKFPLWAKLLAGAIILATMFGALTFTMSLNKSAWWEQEKRTPLALKIKKAADPLAPTSYLEYLPMKAQSWAQNKAQVVQIFGAIAVVLTLLFFLNLALAMVLNRRRGNYDHEQTIEHLYEKRFQELRAAFFRLIRKV